MSDRYSTKICAKCSEPGFRFRGDRWLCIIHHRIDCMKTAARTKGKAEPTAEQLEAMFATVAANGMKCPHCGEIMVMHGKPRSSVVSLQHNRDGSVQLLCMLCNSRHDDMPGDTFYSIPITHKRCPQCKAVFPRSEFWRLKHRLQTKCKECKRTENNAWWDKRRKSCAK